MADRLILAQEAEGSNPSSPAKLNANSVGIPDYIFTIYYDVLCLKRTIGELGCAIFEDGRSFQLNERTEFESWLYVTKNINRIVDIQEFIDIMSGKVVIYAQKEKTKETSKDT